MGRPIHTEHSGHPALGRSIQPCNNRSTSSEPALRLSLVVPLEADVLQPGPLFLVTRARRLAIIASVPRQCSTREPRSWENDGRTPDRLVAVETANHHVQALIDLQFKRIVAIQAQLDHIAVRLDLR